MKDIEYIAEELAYDIVNHEYEQVADVDSLTEIIKLKLKELLTD